MSRKKPDPNYIQIRLRAMRELKLRPREPEPTMPAARPVEIKTGLRTYKGRRQTYLTIT